MVNTKDVDVIILCAGRQARFLDSTRSKLMLNFLTKPIIAHLMDELLLIFKQDQCKFVVNDLFPDLVEFLMNAYPQAELIIDTDVTGTASSLRKAFPAYRPYFICTDGTLFYRRSLIESMLKEMEDTHCYAVFAASKDSAIVAHRPVDVDPPRIYNKSEAVNGDQLRNIGVYLGNQTFQKFIIESEIEKIHEIIKPLCDLGKAAVVRYDGPLLHIAEPSEIARWKDYFEGRAEK